MERNKGTFYILRVQDETLIKEQEGLKIFGVRIAKYLPKGWVHRKECTPSYELLMFCKKLEKEKKYEPELFPSVHVSEEADRYLKENPIWNEYVFRKVYLPNYLKSVNLEKGKKEITEIITHLNKGENVYYACYCANEKICHRNIVAGIIKKQGFEVESLKK